jgi:alcohol dehydrogenase
MRAVIYDAVGEPLRMASVPAPLCPADGAVISVAATGVCRSDWHAWRGREAVPLPHIPGHEFAGVVSAVGPEVRAFAVGDRVTSPFVNGCGRCTWCRSGQAQVCPDQTQPGFTHAGSFAEQVVVRVADTNLVPLPTSVDFISAAAMGCRFATAFRALTGHGPIEPGSWVAVYGCGGVGLSAVMIAVALGMRVVAIDPSPASRAAATALGAVTATTADDVVALTGGGAHVSLDAYGSASSSEASLLSLRRQGRHVQVGLVFDALPLRWDVVIARELRVAGTHGMAAVDYPPMLDMVADGRLNPRRLVGATIDLAEAGAALMAMDEPIAPSAGITVALPNP